MTERPERPLWESLGDMDLAQALTCAVELWGRSAFVKVVVLNTQPVSAEDRLNAVVVLKAMDPPPTSDHLRHLPPETTIAEYEAARETFHTTWNAWFARREALEAIAYPYRYVVGRDDRAPLLFEGIGHTWEEAFEKAPQYLGTGT